MCVFIITDCGGHDGVVKLAADILSLRLDWDQCVRLDDAAGVVLQATAGVLWVTQEGDGMDHILEVGESFLIARRGLTIVSGINEAELRIDARRGCATLQDPARAFFGALVRRLFHMAPTTTLQPVHAQRTCLERVDDFPGCPIAHAMRSSRSVRYR